MKALIWSSNSCPYCDQAKNLLDLHGIKWTENVVGGMYSKEEFKESNPGCTTVPQVWIDGKRIGGFEDLQHHINGMTS